MIRAKGPRVNRLDLTQQWIDTFAQTVYRVAYLYTGDVTQTADLTVRSFTYAYRRMDLSHLFLSDDNAVFAAMVAACRNDDTSSAEVGEGVEGLPKVDDTWLSPLRSLAPDARILFLLRTVAGRSVSDLSRILLVPRRWILARFQASWDELARTSALSMPGGQTTDEDLANVKTQLVDSVHNVDLSDDLKTRIRKTVQAAAQEMLAQRRHRGPGWLIYAVIAMGALSIAAIDVGIHASSPAQATATNRLAQSAQVTGLPNPLKNLPVSTVAQFALNQMPNPSLLSHVVVQSQAVYFPVLQQPGDAWPSIQIQKAAFSTSGQTLTKILEAGGSIPMVPPISSGTTQAGKSSDWQISNWRFDVSGDWGFATVQWEQSNQAAVVTQIYALYFPSGKSGLVKTLSSKSGGSDVAAVGYGYVVSQSGVQNAANSSVNRQTGSANTTVRGTSLNEANSTGDPNTSVVGLPVNVYQVHGTDPLQSLVQENQIPAPFGLMESPTVFPKGLLFTGMRGAQVQPSNADMQWYLLGWNGDLSQFVGPPDDGQQHWAVVGSSDDMWWIETTPNPNGTSVDAWQVLMAPLTADSASPQSPALSLSGAVAWFTAYHSDVAWIQNADGRLQFVVSSVH